MGYHIIHLLGYDYYVKIDHEQLSITDQKTDDVTIIPLDDIAMVIAASPRVMVTTPALAGLAQKNIPLVSCNKKFEPVSITAPYHNCRNTDLTRAQVNISEKTQDELWKKVIQAKISYQSKNVMGDRPKHKKMHELVKKCEDRPPQHMEAQAARIYWKIFFDRLNTMEEVRRQQTKSGYNGMLDYGYMVLRSAILRSLAAHGFIATLGIHHKIRSGGFPLADDLVEPLRPLVDRLILEVGGDLDPDEKKGWREWVAVVSGVLEKSFEVRDQKKKKRLLYIIDSYIESLSRAIRKNKADLLKVPELILPRTGKMVL